MPQPLAPRGVQAGIPGTRLSGLDKPFYKGELDEVGEGGCHLGSQGQFRP